MQRLRFVKAVFGAVLTAIVLAGAPADAVASAIIAPGYDLVKTQTAYFDFSSAGYGLVPFQGIALNNYDFGGVIGSQYVGGTDTIIQRATGGTLTNNGDTITTSIAVEALNLRSINPMSGGPLNGHYVYATAGATTNGSMVITYNGVDGGTWSNDFTFDVQLHIDSFTDPYFLVVSKHFKGHGTWATSPQPQVPIIAGVNDDSFFITGPAIHDAGDGTQHIVIPPVPEPSSMALLSIGGLAGFVQLRRTRSRATKQ